MKRLSSLSTAFGLAAFLGTAGAAWACSIALWYHATPERETTGVPLNAKVTVNVDPGGAGNERTLVWVREVAGAADEAVPFSLSTRPGSGTHENVELTPTSPLQASSTYRVDVKMSGETMEVTRFTTGGAQDTQPPPPPTVEVGEVVPYVHRSDSSGGECYLETGFVRLTARSEGAASFILREGDAVLAAGLPAEASLAFSCPAQTRKVKATLAAVDLAGNVSEAVPVEFEERCVRNSPWGCTAAGSSSLALVAAMAWFAAAFRRRGARLQKW